MTPDFRFDKKELEDFVQNPLKFLKEKNVKSAPERSSGTLPYDEKRLIEKAREEDLRANQSLIAF